MQADPRVVLSREAPRKVFKRIAQEEPSPSCFDDVQAQVTVVISVTSEFCIPLNMSVLQLVQQT